MNCWTTDLRSYALEAAIREHFSRWPNMWKAIKRGDTEPWDYDIETIREIYRRIVSGMSSSPHYAAYSGPKRSA